MKYIDNNFIPWNPSSWPKFDSYNEEFLKIIQIIFNETIIREIDNVINDAIEKNGSLVHRGHVIAIAQLCAIDALSSYAFFDTESETCELCGRKDSKINKYQKYIESFFPSDYKPFAKDLYKLYRNSMVHSWNLFKVGILPDNSAPIKNKDHLIFGLLNFQDSLKKSIDSFLNALKTDSELQKNVMGRYKELQKTAKTSHKKSAIEIQK